ncbi:hypothetical protein C1H46_035522 [Malus baccata]|uniref:Uncharacterized protein n=1 Tax=Malus baccata TaxID=106549 RepID=A0A540KXF9_MALBA|nr:hypothetical protein C1H46_035522 [Malus baccata]
MERNNIFTIALICLLVASVRGQAPSFAPTNSSATPASTPPATTPAVAPKSKSPSQAGRCSDSQQEQEAEAQVSGGCSDSGCGQPTGTRRT